MIKNPKVWEVWERQYQKNQEVDIALNFKLLDSMYDEARALKIFPLKDPLEGLDAKIQMVKALHVSKAS
jgi:hypothetical protein